MLGLLISNLYIFIYLLLVIYVWKKANLPQQALKGGIALVLIFLFYLCVFIPYHFQGYSELQRLAQAGVVNPASKQFGLLKFTPLAIMAYLFTMGLGFLSLLCAIFLLTSISLLKQPRLDKALRCIFIFLAFYPLNEFSSYKIILWALD